MNSASEIRTYRILGIGAVLHSAALVLSVFVAGQFSQSGERWWVGLATLWFFWPIVLALHPGSSARRAIISLTAAALPILVWFRFYSIVVGPFVLGLPDGMYLAPQSVLEYAFHYGHGWVDGKRDINAGRLTFEGYGMSGRMTPDTPEFSDEAMKRFGLEIEPVALCVVDTQIIAHARGHNDATLGEIIRRFGRHEVTAAEEEEKRNQERYSAALEDGKANAERDLRNGHLVLEVYQRSQELNAGLYETMRDRFQIEIRQVGESMLTASRTVSGHRLGYNEVAEKEIERRFGGEALKLVLEAQSEPIPSEESR